jgi:hypothetical protein
MAIAGSEERASHVRSVPGLLRADIRRGRTWLSALSSG